MLEKYSMCRVSASPPPPPKLTYIKSFHKIMKENDTDIQTEMYNL
jgi:hypothetical protein